MSAGYLSRSSNFVNVQDLNNPIGHTHEDFTHLIFNLQVIKNVDIFSCFTTILFLNFYKLKSDFYKTDNNIAMGLGRIFSVQFSSVDGKPGSKFKPIKKNVYTVLTHLRGGVRKFVRGSETSFPIQKFQNSPSPPRVYTHQSLRSDSELKQYLNHFFFVQLNQ